MSKFKLCCVENTHELNEWINFTSTLYPDNRYIPPIKQKIQKIFKNKTPLTNDIDVKFYCIKDESNRIVARTTVQASKKFNEKLKDNVQLFGFTEFVNDYQVFEFMMDEVKSLGEGKNSLFGPANLLPNQSGGVIKSGFEERGFLDGTYNHEYYPEFFERYGFEEVYQSNTYICENLDTNEIDEEKFSKKVNGLEIHSGNRFKFKKQLRTIHSMLNDSFETLGYYTNISLDELYFQCDGLEFIFDEKLFLYVTKDDEPIGFILCVPDISEEIARMKGNLNFINLIKLLMYKSNDAILIIKGVIPSEMGKGVMSVLSRELLKNLKERKYKTLRTTWIEEENKGSASQFLKMNGRILNKLTFYKMNI